MIKAHICWIQGWDVAPPRALRCIEAWKERGFELHLWEERNCGISFSKFFNYAAKTDIILAQKVFKMGGLALGADTSPLDTKGLIASINSLPENTGQIVWQSRNSWTKNPRPYNGCSYFPRKHPFLGEVVRQHKEILAQDINKNINPVKVTGPDLWSRVYKEFSENVNIVCGSKVFLKEPRVSKRSESAWIDAGLTGDWDGKKSHVWL